MTEDKSAAHSGWNPVINGKSPQGAWAPDARTADKCSEPSYKGWGLSQAGSRTAEFLKEPVVPTGRNAKYRYY